MAQKLNENWPDTAQLLLDQTFLGYVDYRRFGCYHRKVVAFRYFIEYLITNLKNHLIKREEIRKVNSAWCMKFNNRLEGLENNRKILKGLKRIEEIEKRIKTEKRLHCKRFRSIDMQIKAFLFWYYKIIM